jgi:hypothetical protein
MGDENISKEEFLELPDGKIRRLILQKNKPLAGIFVTDGNRRLVITQTGLTPTSKDFYPAYLKIVTESFRENLRVFFGHGLHTLIFPLFGPPILKRDKTYRRYVIPELVRTLFRDPGWLAFYREYGIRVMTYGDLEPLQNESSEFSLVETVKSGVEHTSSHQQHMIFYGFFANGIYEDRFIDGVLRFIQIHHRKPTPREWVELYYGVPVTPADFLITSTRVSFLGTLPPLLYGKGTKVYTLVAPGVFALTKRTFREILYDLIFIKSRDPGFIVNAGQEDIEFLKGFYRRNRDRIIGIEKIAGNCRVLDI